MEIMMILIKIMIGYAIGITGFKGFLSSMDEMGMLLPKSFQSVSE
jgi:hypothetical protein